VVLSVRDVTADPEVEGELAFLPARDDGGYHLPAVADGASARRTFAIKPVDAEAGKTYRAEGSATWGGGEQHNRLPVKVEARPEVYAVIGAASRAREFLLDQYRECVEAGRKASNTALPTTHGDPGSMLLDERTFQWALGLVEAGTRLAKEQADGRPTVSFETLAEHLRRGKVRDEPK
jgi:hypothetical protein